MLAIVLGTRPEIIKTAPIVFEAQRRGEPVAIIHTGQHYSEELDGIFFRELGLPDPHINLAVGSHPAPRQLGRMLDRLHDAFLHVKPTRVMVQGDTNTVLAGALAAFKADIPVAHLEAGMRCDDWTLPEEANRVLADRVSQWLFCPTELQSDRAIQEGIDRKKIHVVGNSVVDAVRHFAERASRAATILIKHDLTPRTYCLLTLHRASNVDDPVRLQRILDHIDASMCAHGLRVLFPVHPRTADIISRHEVRMGLSMLCTAPMGYLDLLHAQQQAALILTDSGGIQEEACTLRVPCIILRPNTERPEVLQIGAATMHEGLDAEGLHAAVTERLGCARLWENPFGDGRTAERVMDILMR